MEHSKMFEKIKYWFIHGLWTKKQVYNAVPKLITEEEYNEIIGETL